jgi:hypothetical protein
VADTDKHSPATDKTLDNPTPYLSIPAPLKEEKRLRLEGAATADTFQQAHRLGPTLTRSLFDRNEHQG